MYAQVRVRVRPRLSVSVYVCFLHCYLHKKLELAFCTPDYVYYAVGFFLLFRRFSVVVGCGIWLSYFMTITFYRHRRVFAFQKFRTNVHVRMKFHIQYNFKNTTLKTSNFFNKQT